MLTKITIVLFGISLFGLIRYVDYRYNGLLGEIENINNSQKVTEQEFGKNIKNLSEVLLGTLTEEQKKNEELKDALGEITDTVETLEKLSVTDKELLKKYSKVYFLNEHYVPISLSTIDSKFVNEKGKNFQIHSNVMEYLEDLLNEANDDGMFLQVFSAFRSFGTQSVLKANYTFSYGAGTANQFSADQGYSEHQLGTALDFTTVKLNGAMEGFDQTPEYKWLQDNAYKYGFILSYPVNNTYYKFEPWHWRFVGVSLAKKLHRDNMYFYDMDQRVIDGYLVKIFD